jgi:hypothetical protein
MTAPALAIRTAPSPPVPPGHRALGWLAAVGTLPYLALKILWLTGSTVGTSDASFLSDPGIAAMNWVTLAMDVTVVGLALALTHGWGDRLPAWLALLPMWVGTGFLVPMAVSIMPTTVALIATGAGGGGPLLPWVQPMVYGGFAWQGIFLCAAFVGHARRRWAGVVTTAAPATRSLAPLLRVVTGGGVVMAGLSALLQAAVGLAEGEPAALTVQGVNAALAVAGAVGVLALVRGIAAHRWTAVAAAWIGSAAMFSWGLYSVVVAVAVSPLAGTSPLGGLAQLTGLLGGFALAVAGLLAVAGTGVAEPR